MDELISKADIAMYKAKQNDKCKVIYENSQVNLTPLLYFYNLFQPFTF